MAALYFAYLLLFAGLDAVERKRVLVLIVLFPCGTPIDGYQLTLF
jgi:hypothetical protein